MYKSTCACMAVKMLSRYSSIANGLSGEVGGFSSCSLLNIPGRVTELTLWDFLLRKFSPVIQGMFILFFCCWGQQKTLLRISATREQWSDVLEGRSYRTWQELKSARLWEAQIQWSMVDLQCLVAFSNLWEGGVSFRWRWTDVNPHV